MQRYTERQLARGERLSAVLRHLQGLYEGEPGSGEFRRTLSEGARRPGAGAEVLAEAVATAEGSGLLSLEGPRLPARRADGKRLEPLHVRCLEEIGTL